MSLHSKMCHNHCCCRPLTDKEKLAAIVVLGATAVTVSAFVVVKNADRIREGMDSLKYKMEQFKRDIVRNVKKADEKVEEAVGSITIELRRETDEVIQEAEALIAELKKRMEKEKKEEQE